MENDNSRSNGSARPKAVAWCNCKKINSLNGIVKWTTGHHIDHISDEDTDAAGFFFKTQTRAHDTSTCIHCGYLVVWNVENPTYVREASSIVVAAAAPTPANNEQRS